MSNRNRDQGDDFPKVSSPYVFEDHTEADLGGPTAEPGARHGTISPDEEDPVTRGFQHGGWSYETNSPADDADDMGAEGNEQSGADS